MLGRQRKINTDKQWSGPMEERKQTETEVAPPPTMTFHEGGILTLNKPKQEIGGGRGAFK